MQEQIAAIKTWLGQGSLNIFGMPNAGKDTQGQVLADLLDAELMGGGQILRGSVIPQHVKRIMEAGDLIPTEDYLQIVLPYLSQETFAGRSLMLSSVGRWDGEQHGVIKAAEQSGHPLKAAILLTVTESVARRRHNLALQSGDRGVRADDNEAVFANRLNEYQIKTLPVINYYRSEGLLLEVDGSANPPRVTEDIIEKLSLLAAQA